MSGKPLTQRDSRAERRGSSYVAVMGVTLLVMTIGMSALAAVRIQRKGALASAEVVKTRYAAQSIAELALFKIAGDVNWRSTYTHDTWTTPLTVDGIDYAFKLVDEVDTDLANDPYHSVRLYARAETGDAARLYSVLLSAQPTENLLKNGDMEAGLSSWSGTDWTAATVCTLEHKKDSPHGGKWETLAKTRNAPSSGPLQNISTVIATGTTYYARVWVRMKDSADLARITVYVIASDASTGSFSTGWTSVGTGWTQVAGTMTPAWSGNLARAFYFIETSGDKQDFYADDALLIQGTSEPGTEVAIVPGTWQREAAE